MFVGKKKQGSQEDDKKNGPFEGIALNICCQNLKYLHKAAEDTM